MMKVSRVDFSLLLNEHTHTHTNIKPNILFLLHRPFVYSTFIIEQLQSNCPTYSLKNENAFVHSQKSEGFT